MDLDDRARRAADALRHQTSDDLDITGAADVVAAAGRRRLTRRRQARIGVFAVVGLAVVGALGLAAVHDGPADDRAGPDLETDRSTTSVPAATTTEPPRSELEILAALPSGPLDGKDSWRLPVTASPQTGMADGQTITVIGRGFEAHERLAIVQCGAEANTGEAANACSLGTPGNQFAYVTYTDADADGGVIGQVEVRSTIDTPIGQIGCASAPERCILGIGALSNYDRSGSTYIDFAGSGEFAPPTLAVSPATDLALAQDVTIRATGLVAHRRVNLGQCDGTACVAISTEQVGADGTLSVVRPGSADRDELPTCVGGCRIALTYADGPGTTAPEPDPVPVTFATGGARPGGFAPGTTTTTSAPTAATTTSTTVGSPTTATSVAAGGPPAD